MRISLLIIVTVFATYAKAQVLVNIQVPSTGIMQKSQLWNLSLTNTSAVPLSIHIELMMIERSNSQQVLSASTPVIVLPVGFTQITNSILQPIQYNLLSSAYVMDANPAGLLPIGDFEVCYNILNHYSDAVDRIAEQCQDILIEPIAPPLLMLPSDQSTADQKNPLFTWLAPMPSFLFTQLKYDLDIVEVMSFQTATDAMQQNIPILQQKGIAGTSLLYPAGNAYQLQPQKQYAWRIIARNNEALVSQSEVWSFKVGESSLSKSMTGQFPYAKLQKTDIGGYAVFSNELKFDYLNETGDKKWMLKVIDLTSSMRETIPIDMDSIRLNRGQNLVKIDFSNDKRFLSGGFYLLEITNTRKEVWRLRFQFKRTEFLNNN